jgi:hypothetical protein
VNKSYACFSSYMHSSLLLGPRHNGNRCQKTKKATATRAQRRSS